MSKQETNILATYYVWCAGIWILMRYLGTITTPLSLLGAIGLSWLLSSPVMICVKTALRRRRSTFKDVPGPESINWLYDHILDVFDEPLAHKVTHWINERSYPDGMMHFFGLYGSEYIVPTDPEGLVEVLSTRSYDFEKARAFRRYAERFFGDGLVSQEQEVHKRNRKTFMPVFNQTNINLARPMVTAKSRQFNECISSLCSQNMAASSNGTRQKTAVVYITDLVFGATMDTASVLAFGVDLETVKGQHNHLLEALKTIFASNRQKRTRFILHNLLPWWLDRLIPSDDEKQMDAAKSLLADAICDIISKNPVEKDGGNGHLTYLSNLVQSGTFNEDEHIAQLNTILAAGFESSGGSLSFVIYCLAANQKAQEAVREEMIRAKNGRAELDEDEYDRLPVLNAMVMESLRLFPSFGLLLRKAIRDTTIKGRFIPRGTNISICPRAINYAHHLWGETAEEFNLERWIDRSDPDNPLQTATGGALTSTCMLSFGYGTRSCVGRNLAMAQIKRQIALIAERFHVETVDDGVPHPSGMFASAPPLDLRLRFTELD